MILSSLGFSKQFEVLLIIAIGICVLALDTSIFHVREVLEDLWKYEFDPELRKNNIDQYLKYLMSGVILIRTFTVHIFLALYVTMLWPAIYADRPNLMLPWLVVGSIRSILVNVITLVTGICLCVFLKGYHLVCLDFVLSQIIDHGPSVYAWLTVLSYYRELCSSHVEETRKESQDSKIVTRRRKTRSIQPEVHFSERPLERTSLKSHVSDTNLKDILSASGNEKVVPVKLFRSLDSLLKKMPNSSQFTNTENEAKDIPNLSQRAMKMFQLTNEDIRKVNSDKIRNRLELNKDESVITSVELNVDKKIERTKCSLNRPPCTSLRNINARKSTENKCQCKNKKKNALEIGEDSNKIGKCKVEFVNQQERMYSKFFFRKSVRRWFEYIRRI